MVDSYVPIPYNPTPQVFRRNYEFNQYYSVYNGVREEASHRFSISGAPVLYKALNGERGPKPRKTYPRNVYHRVITTQGFNVPESSYEWVDSGGTGSAYVGYRNQTLALFEPEWIALAMQVRNPLASWVPDIDTLVDAAVDQVYRPPSVINSIVEFSEIPELMLQGWRMLGFLNLPPNVLRNTMGRIIRDPRVMLQVLTDSVLTTNLGLLPTFSEIAAYVDVFQNALNRYSDALRMVERGEGFRVATSKRAAIETSAQYAQIYDYSYGGTVKRSYTAYCTASFPRGNAVSSSALAAVGVNLDLQTLWNMLPMSFVIDYLVPVGEALRRARIYSELSILHACRTDLFDGEFSGRSRSVEGVTRQGAHEGNFRVFNRERYGFDAPDGIAVQDISLLPSPTQMANILALGSSFRNLGRAL